jgi:molybdate-binding protein/DNA-binding XRE family transcriptional regulator
MILSRYDTIMSTNEQLRNRVKENRLARGWSQAELSQRVGISRASVSAIEISRLVPSVEAALALAGAFGCAVEDLFGAVRETACNPVWAWPPTVEPCRYLRAQVGGRTVLYPAEGSRAVHDGVYRGGSCFPSNDTAPAATAVLASCDPAAQYLADQVAYSTGFRLLVLPRSGQQALALLGQGLVHFAGVHLSTANAPDRNARSVKAILGTGFQLLRVARWEEGLAVGSGAGVRSVRSALRGKLRWVGREPGSAARQCLDELRANRPAPRRLARDHRGVAEAIRCGWADVGVCLRLVCEEADLKFLGVREESYDLCYAAAAATEPRIRGVIEVIRSLAYRRQLGELPGYDTADTGEIRAVD